MAFKTVEIEAACWTQAHDLVVVSFILHDKLILAAEWCIGEMNGNAHVLGNCSLPCERVCREEFCFGAAITFCIRIK